MDPLEQELDQARQEYYRGEFAGSLRSFEAALRIARARNDTRSIDVCRLNRAMLLVQTGKAREGEEGLREILLRTNDDRLAFGAAFHLASSLRRQGRYERAWGFADRAADRARALGDRNLEASVLNLRGNIKLNQNYLDDALAEYHAALAIREELGGDQRFHRAILSENVGYCLLLREQIEDGISWIENAFAIATEIDDRRCRAECLQDLCYANLLRGRWDEANRQGQQALNEAVAAGYCDIEENCHYLLGELGSRTGSHEQRDEHFGRLQELHPELPFLREFLCTVDVTRIITLKR